MSMQTKTVRKTLVAAVALLVLGWSGLTIQKHLSSGDMHIVIDRVSEAQVQDAVQQLGLVEHTDANGNKMYSGVSADPAIQKQELDTLMDEWMSPAPVTALN